MVFTVKVFMCRLVNLTIAYYEARDMADMDRWHTWNWGEWRHMHTSNLQPPPGFVVATLPSEICRAL